MPRKTKKSLPIVEAIAPDDREEWGNEYPLLDGYGILDLEVPNIDYDIDIDIDMTLDDWD